MFNSKALLTLFDLDQVPWFISSTSLDNISFTFFLITVEASFSQNYRNIYAEHDFGLPFCPLTFLFICDAYANEYRP
jgi:hypothetical protein